MSKFSLIRFLVSLFLGSVIISSCNTVTKDSGKDNDFPELSGVYLGQTIHEDTLAIFAENILSDGAFVKNVSFTWGGGLLFYSKKTADQFTIFTSQEVDEIWEEPVIASFSGEYSDFDPYLTSRGNGLYFTSNRPAGSSDENKNFDIWFTISTMAGWTDPQNIGEPVNSTLHESSPSTTRKGALYFLRTDPETVKGIIYRAAFDSGTFSEPEALPEIINDGRLIFDPVIAPDESYLVFASIRDNSLGGSDLYISFRDEDDNWEKPVNLGKMFNTVGYEHAPFITPGGKTFFYASTGNPLEYYTSETDSNPETQHVIDTLSNSFYLEPPQKDVVSNIYWVRTKIIKKLKP